jgi:hypothetical protein
MATTKTTNYDRYLRQLPQGWEKWERGYILRSEHGTCELYKDGTLWIVFNVSSDGARWGQWYPSFKQALAAIAK